MIFASEKVLRRVALENGRRLRAGISRSLAACRYVQVGHESEAKQQKNAARRLSALGIRDGETLPDKILFWRQFALSLAGEEGEKSPKLLFACQRSRLMVGMAGGVFENGGLTLDRTSGIPYIPGSAVKGCARRAALAALQEWVSGLLAAGDSTNPLSPILEGFQSPGDLLLAICHLFGWADEDWKGKEGGDEQPEFQWACGGQWDSIRKFVSGRLCGELGISPGNPDKPWESLPQGAGSICFLPAYPWEGDPGIDLDVITCHHPVYYSPKPSGPSDKVREWEDHRSAPDTEAPEPHIFPAVSPGQKGNKWGFLFHPSARAGATDLSNARRWLAVGLETFGIGAKTNAGYGWFVPLASEADPLGIPLASEAETLGIPLASEADPLGIPLASEAETFLETWGEKKLNSFSMSEFIRRTAAIKQDGELLRVFTKVIPEKIRDIQFRDPFWNPFRTNPQGKVLLERLQKVLAAP
jgi:CRISPR-associated protein Cmr6